METEGKRVPVPYQRLPMLPETPCALDTKVPHLDGWYPITCSALPCPPMKTEQKGGKKSTIPGQVVPFPPLPHGWPSLHFLHSLQSSDRQPGHQLSWPRPEVLCQSGTRPFYLEEERITAKKCYPSVRKEFPHSTVRADSNAKSLSSRLVRQLRG